jgi:phospholipase A1
MADSIGCGLRGPAPGRPFAATIDKGVRMKRVLIIAAMAALSLFPLAAQGTDDSEFAMPGFTSYKPIYFAAGWGDLTAAQLNSNDLILVNFSFKYDPFYQYKVGVYLAYTQTMYWAFFSNSSPFKEINFRPELFFRFESGNNFAGDVAIPFFDYFQTGWEHRSNGQDGALSRGWDRVYAQLQLGYGDIVHIGANVKYFYYLNLFSQSGFSSLADNPNIRDYTSNFEFQVVANLDIPVFPMKVVLSGGPGGGPNAFDFAMGWQQLDVYFLKLAGNLRPYLQVWNGYGQSIQDYDQTSFNAHAGLAIEI